MHSLRNWFSKRCTKEEFDLQARRMMGPDIVHLHNQVNNSLALSFSDIEPTTKDKSRMHENVFEIYIVTNINPKKIMTYLFRTMP